MTEAWWVMEKETCEEIREGINTKSLVVDVKAFVFNSNFYMLLLFSRCHVQFFVMPWTAENQAILSLIISWNLLKFMSIESVMLSNHCILCFLILLPSIFPRIRVLSSESPLRTGWPKYWSISFSTNPSNEYSGLISFRTDLWSPCSPRDSQVFPSTSVPKHQFFSA